MTRPSIQVLKPRALRQGSRIALFAPASPAEVLDWAVGKAELVRMGFDVELSQDFSAEGYFAGPLPERLKGFLSAVEDSRVSALVSLRGGYGSSYLLSEHLRAKLAGLPDVKCVIGYSDITSLQIFLWQMCGWVTFYGPMAAAGFARGAGDLKGFDEQSFRDATGNTKGNWRLNLKGEPLHAGSAEGLLLGGCLTMIQTSLATPWELDTEGSILVLPDSGPTLQGRTPALVLEGSKR
jgi:muramoyltetrapeptide carboxypeptidase